MPKAIATIPLSPFHNVAAGDLADQLGELKAEIAALEIREKALRDELIRRGAAEVEGADYNAAITAAVRWTLDAKAVRSEMGDAWWNARCHQALVTTVTVRVRGGAVKIAA
jgi:hypothetical protein